MSTGITQEAGAEQDLNGLLQKVGDLLAGHPAGDRIALLVRPVELVLPAEYVLVQVVNGEAGTVTLEPCHISTLTDDTVLHDSQILPTGDPSASASKAFIGPYAAGVDADGAFAHAMTTRDDDAS